jgi:hypothetical protein
MADLKEQHFASQLGRSATDDFENCLNVTFGEYTVERQVFQLFSKFKSIVTC